MEKKNKKQKPPSKAAKDGQDSHKANWREVYATVDDIKAFLDDNALLRYNTVTGRLEGHVVERDVWEQVEQAATRGGRQDYGCAAAGDGCRHGEGRRPVAPHHRP